MEFSPLIMAAFALILSLTASALTLRAQSAFFEPLTTRTHRFDCEDPLSLLTNPNTQQTVLFSGETEDCMLPNLYKDRANDESRVEEMFATLLARCAAGECQ